MCKGKIVYSGKPDKIRGYFTDMGIGPSEHTNPADHLMSILDSDSLKIDALRNGVVLSKTELNSMFKERLDTMVAAHKCSPNH